MTTVFNQYITCMIPFAYREKTKKQLYRVLKNNNYTFFSLKDRSLEQAYYGDVVVSHEELDQHFLPYIENRLFPKQEDENSFLRYSKQVNERATLSIREQTYGFELLSTDIVLCPFQLGFVTLRLKMEEPHTLHESADFMHHFRILEPKLPHEKGMTLTSTQGRYDSVSDYTFEELCPFLETYLNHDMVRDGYFGSLPYFEDERMLMSTYVELSAQPSTREMYALSQLDGLDTNGEAYVSAENESYMEQYLQKRTLERFAPKATVICTEHVFLSTMFPEADKPLRHLALERFMSIDYYQLLLHYFYKLTLLKLSYEHSEVNTLHDQDFIEHLIRQIDQFSASFYFQEISSRSSGIEMGNKLQTIFKVNPLYEEVKATLESLYRTQENTSAKRQDGLLFMLTIFTVLSGIYGMNLIIDDWKGKYDWSKIAKYSLLEWISLITAVGGIAITLVVVGIYVVNKIRAFLRKQKRKRYE